MPVTFDRRAFLGATGSAFAALVASGCTVKAPDTSGVSGQAMLDVYGALKSDPAGLLDLPEGFSYRLISSLGDAMSDGGTVPDRADGMGCFELETGELVLVRNHELRTYHKPGGSIAKGYRKGKDGKILPGGTTNIVLDAASLEVKREFRSLGGTIRNCAGGTTPWGTWLSCEESGEWRTKLPDHHGYIFEVSADAEGLVDAAPLKAMGRFNHEAACVDPETGIVYLTEDREDSVFYRFIPATLGDLSAGGRLQAMALANGISDTRNHGDASLETGRPYEVRWIDCDDVESPADDLRNRMAAQGAALVARGEGIHMGDGELFFCCTNGGAAECGQVFRLVPGRGAGPDLLELFFESESVEQFNYGDNLCVAPNGHLIVCEDEYADTVANRLIGITPEGKPYVFARLNMQTELAGACFSPDGSWLFVNAYSPTKTFAIRGPWAS